MVARSGWAVRMLAGIPTFGSKQCHNTHLLLPFRSAEPTPAAGLPVRLSVNFDAELDKLLREVHDFLLMPSLSIASPEPALALYERSELFRQQISALGLVADIHNTISSTIIPVESGLLLQQLADVEACMRRGVEVRRGSGRWQSVGA